MLLNSLQALRSAPAFLADESAAALCETSPPCGLLESTSTLKWLLNRSKGRQNLLCLDFAKGLIEASRRSSHTPPTDRKFTCAVVGSSGGLKNSQSGRLIDSHDIVIRSNFAPAIGPVVRDVGSRTTYRIMAHHAWRYAWILPGWNASSTRSEVLYCLDKARSGLCHLEVLRPAARTTRAGRARSGRPLVINPVLVRRISDLLRQHGGELDRPSMSLSNSCITPSTGIVTVALALALGCDQPSLFGFSNITDASKAGECSHYYEDCRRSTRGNQSWYFRRGHAWQAHWKLVEALIHIGAVRYYKEYDHSH